MINRKISKRTGVTKVTFSLDDTRPVSVIGDFNQWDPLQHPLTKRSNGLKSAVVEVSTGTELRFRYLAEGGEFFDDPDADQIEYNGLGTTHGVVETQTVRSR